MMTTLPNPYGISSSTEQAVDSIPKAHLCKNFFDFHIFLVFLVFYHDFIIHIDFTRIAASNIATDDVTN